MKRLIGIISAAFLAGQALTACGVDQSTFDDSVDISANIGEVTLSTRSGSVEVVRDPSAKTVRVARHVTFSGSRPGETTSVTGSTLNVEDCGGDCGVNYAITVPAEGVRVRGNVDSGNVTLTGVGEVDLTHRSGEVDIDGCAGLKVRGGSGALRAANVRGDVQATVDSGSADLRLSAPASIDLRVESGQTSVTVPRGEYDLEVTTKSGTVDSALPDTPGASHVITVVSGSGDVGLRLG